MVLGRPFYCPTKVVQSSSFESTVGALIEGRCWAVVTSAGWVSRGAINRLIGECGLPQVIVDNIGSNPTYSEVIRTAAQLKGVDVIVALGGGSVIDAAKGAAALAALGHDIDKFYEHLRNGDPLPDDLAPLPIISVPTTSGTGAEVTRWGTIWGDDGLKHSVAHAGLYPSHAVLDPALCTTMGPDLTLTTALDALSHAAESVWNKNSTPTTDALAALSIEMIRLNLNNILEEPGNIVLRRDMQTAALMAGLAMGTTQTALAHSISYPFTSRYGVPHGLACSFTLPYVALYNLAEDPTRMAPIAKGLGCTADEIPDVLKEWLKELGLGAMLAAYVSADVADSLDDSLITRARAANNLRDVDGAAAREIVRKSVRHLFE